MQGVNLQKSICNSKLLVSKRNSLALMIPARFLVAIFLIGGGVFAPFKISLNQTAAEDPQSFELSDFSPNIPEQPAAYNPLPVEAGLGSRYIIVSLADQRLQAFKEGEKVFETMVSTGSPERPTPKGLFKILNKAPRAYSRVAALYMPYWMAYHFDGQYWLGFHELPEWPGGIKEGAEHLGLPVSGGCIRLGAGEAKKLYDWAEIGDKVLIY